MYALHSSKLQEINQVNIYSFKSIKACRVTQERMFQNTALDIYVLVYSIFLATNGRED